MAVQGAKYEIFKIRSADGQRVVDLYEGQFRVGNIYYYENILSPQITGIITIISTSGVVQSQEDVQKRVGSLHTSLPLEVGCEILLKIKDVIGNGIDFSSITNPHKRLYVNEVQIIDKSANSEIIQLRFTSKIGWTNTTKRVTRHFDGLITESVRNILKNDFKLDDDMIEIDSSSNTLSFAGMTKRPFDLIKMLAKQSIPANTANPGYFYYQTKSGFKYLAADTLINSTPYPRSYYYNSFNESSYQSKSDDSDYKIASLTVSQDQNLTNQIRSGVYASKTIFFNPSTYEFKEIDISVNDGKLYKDPKFSTLGKKPEIPKILQEQFDSGVKYHKVETAILNVGADNETVDVNNSPEFYYAASSTRYNILFNQKYSITIPCNTTLEAGDVLNIEIEDTSNQKEMGPDQRYSGRYVIYSLCHYFEAEKSTTNMNLIRDSYGLHTSNNATPKRPKQMKNDTNNEVLFY